MTSRKAAAIACLLAAWISLPSASAEPIVFIVSYHNVDYAKVACDQVVSMEDDAKKTVRDLSGNKMGLEPADWVKDTITAAAECRSVRDFRELGRRLENELTDALAVEPLCGGVTVIRDPHPDFDKLKNGFSKANDDVKQKQPFWDLHLDYRPGEKVFGWTLFPNKAGMKSDGPLVSGDGDTIKAAKQICTVVTRRGATIR